MDNKTEEKLDTKLDGSVLEMGGSGFPDVGTVLWQVLGNSKLLRCTVESVTTYGSTSHGHRCELIISRSDSAQRNRQKAIVTARTPTRDFVVPGLYWTRAAAIAFVMGTIKASDERAKARLRAASERRNAAMDDIAEWESREVTDGVSR